MADSNDKGCWVGFDLGGTKMLATVFDSAFRAVARKRRRTRGQLGKPPRISRIVQTIRQALDQSEIGSGRLRGIGVGCPGPLDLDKGIVLDAPNLGWKKVKLADAIKKEFACPVVVLNDVDAGVYGENRFGAAQKARCVIGVFPGTGVGGGCVYDGKILRGTTSSCMEIGHVQVLPNGPRCGCGLIGCLEAVASRLAISAAAAQAAYRGQAPHLLELAGTDISKIRSGVLAASVAAGDAAIEQILQRAGAWIGVAVATAVHLLAPDVVVLGGGLVEAMPKLFVTAVTESARAHVLPSFASTFEVKVAELGDDAVVMGAAGWAQTVVESQSNSR